MRKIDEYVIDYACEDTWVKVANVKLVKKSSPGEGGGGYAPKCPQEHLRVPTYRRIPLASPGLIHAHFGDLVG